MISRINEVKQQQIEETKKIQQKSKIEITEQQQTKPNPIPDNTTQKVSSQVILPKNNFELIVKKFQ